MQDGWTAELRVRARSGYDVRTQCIRGCTERLQGVRPGRIRHKRNCVLAEYAWRIVQAFASRDGHFADGLIAKAQLKNVENRPIDADSR